MSNQGEFFKTVDCKDENFCKSSKYCCKTCLRNRLIKLEDKFSLNEGGYKETDKWFK